MNEQLNVGDGGPAGGSALSSFDRTALLGFLCLRKARAHFLALVSASSLIPRRHRLPITASRVTAPAKTSSAISFADLPSSQACRSFAVFSVVQKVFRLTPSEAARS